MEIERNTNLFTQVRGKFSRMRLINKIDVLIKHLLYAVEDMQ